MRMTGVIGGVLVSVAAVLAQAHSADHHADLIQQARIEQLADTFTDPGLLLAQCKYVSNISTPPPKNRVVLTFDDGPDPIGTPYVLDVLEKFHIKATFFMVGQVAQARPELVKKVVAAGHQIVSSHSWSHPSFHKLTSIEQATEIAKAEKQLGSHMSPRFFRYPFGNSTCESNDLLHRRGYKIAGWHIDTCDWAFNKTGTVSEVNAGICGVRPENTSNFIGHVIDRLRARRGGIVLMHDIQPNTILQLEKLVREMISAGFDFAKLDDPDFASSMR